MANFIVNDSVEKYMSSLLPPRDPVLAEMERRARRERIPIIGPAVGRLLAQLIAMSKARRIFEMGSAIGYSTLWLARAAGSRAEVHYSDGDPALARDAQAYFRRAGIAKRIHIHVGDAVELLAETRGPFDLIFNDVDKHQYPAAFRTALPRLARGGLLVTDNALWSGRVAGRASDRDTRGVREFNRLSYASPLLFSVIIPLRDGVMVSRKR
jgi:predicted O-methyltransferase YrrM